jgi:hypothetical protein
MCFSVVLLLSACGDETAPIGATVSGPEDGTIAVSPSGTPPIVTLSFGVTDASGNPVPGVDIEVFADASASNGAPSVALLDVDGNGLGTNAVEQTDDRGLLTVRLVVGFDTNCAGVDITATAIVAASVGTASDLWTGTYTVKCT